VKALTSKEGVADLLETIAFVMTGRLGRDDPTDQAAALARGWRAWAAEGGAK